MIKFFFSNFIYIIILLSLFRPPFIYFSALKMAAFSYQQHLAAVPSFLDLSVLLPNTSSHIKMSGLLEEEEGYIDNISTCFPTYSSLTDQQFPIIEKQKTDSSSIVEGNSSDYQVSTDKMMVMTPKRKNRDGSCLSSSESKDSKRNTRAKKQRNCSDNDTQKIKSKVDNKMKKNQKKDPEATTQSGYVHVRARRGEATDSHSLAERVRREKISERLKLLQSLVPGCDKVTSKALMLDEIINYVQSLQHQVEFLSMKLATMSPITYDMGGLSSALVVTDDIAAPFTTANSSNLLINNPVSYYLLQQAAGGQRSNNNVLCQQDNGNLLWSSVDQQRPTRFFNQSDFNSLCSFQ